MDLETIIEKARQEWKENPKKAKEENEVISKYGKMFNPKNIDKLTAENFKSFLNYRNNKHWTGLDRQGSQITQDMERFKKTLKLLLDETIPIDQRIKRIRDKNSLEYHKGFGTAYYTPVLLVVYPKKYPVINKIVKDALQKTGIYPDYDSKPEWVSYSEVSSKILELAEKYNISLWQMDSMWWKLYTNLDYEGLYTFITKIMDAKSTYQPIMIRTILEMGIASKETIDKQIRKENPGKTNNFVSHEVYEVLVDKHKIVKLDRNGYKLNLVYPLTELERKKLIELCNQKIENIRKNHEELLEKSQTAQYFLVQVNKPGSENILNFSKYEHYNWQKTSRDFYHGKVKEGDKLLVYFAGNSINYRMQLKKIYKVKKVSEKNDSFDLLEEMELNGLSLNDIKVGIQKGKLRKEVFGKLSQQGFNIIKIDESDYESVLSLDNDSKLENKYQLWVVRAGDRGQGEKVALENNCVGIGYDGLPGLHLIKDFKLFKAHYIKTHPTDHMGRVGKVVPQIWNFMYGMQIGDFVLLPLKTHKSKLIAVGTIRGEYKYENLNSEIQQYRPVKWLKKDVDINEFDTGIIKLVDERGTVYRIGGSNEVNKVKDMLKRLGVNEIDLENINNINTTSIQPNKNDNKILLSLTDISQITYFPIEILKEIESLLLDKKQIIFYGSPGTSKTFLAKNFSEYFAQDIENVRIIQFHQSYSYEDFIEGIKPKLSETGEAIGFTRQSGIFKNLVQDCIQHPSKRFVLIIDEINRGNISKIFGELIYLLEYRDEKISLTYSPQEDFFIPSNLYIIGTMNSADRSIAFVDYALRRRFYFKEFYPDTNGNILHSWYKDNNIKEVDPHQIVTLLNEINQKISEQIGREYQIGYSYFMVKNLDKIKLKNIIDYAITPLIEQYFFGKKQRVEEIKQLWSTILSTPTLDPQTSTI